MKGSLFCCEGFGVVDQPRLGAADTAAAEEVGAKANELAAPAAGIGADGSLEFILLAAPPSIAAVEIGTSGTGSAVVPPNAITEYALTHVFKFFLINIISDTCWV